MSKELEDWLHEEKAESKAEGIATGTIKGKHEDAVEMLKAGLSFDKIAKYTKLPLQAIESLAHQHTPSTEKLS